jgi:hypothetical protein
MLILKSSFERDQIANVVSEAGGAPIYCRDSTEAELMFKEKSFDFRLVLFGADAQGVELLDQLLSVIELRGYERKQWFWGLSDKVDDFEVEYQLRIRGAEWCALRPTELLRRIRALKRQIDEYKQPEFRLVHWTDINFEGRCLADEVISNLFITHPPLIRKAIALSATPLVFADAILRYSSEGRPKTAATLLQLMAADATYMSAIPETSLTKRNFITHWYRIKEEGVRPMLGPVTDECMVSEHAVGGEHVFYFRAETVVEHKIFTPSDKTA